MRHCLRGVTHRKEARSMKRNLRVKTMILDTIKMQKGLFAAILFAVTGAIISALLPPLVLARIIDGITAGDEVSASFLMLYFLLLALTGFLEAAREGLLTVFGQKMTHALRSSLMEKFGRLTSDNVNRQEPGMLVSRFVGDVDTVENLFTSGIVSMFADACKIISILAVIWFRNRGLTFVLLVLLPFLFWFTRHVQKNMLSAQIENRRAVGRASGHVPETLHNIRTIHCLKKEAYMEALYVMRILLPDLLCLSGPVFRIILTFITEMVNALRRLQICRLCTGLMYHLTQQLRVLKHRARPQLVVIKRLTVPVCHKERLTQRI